MNKLTYLTGLLMAMADSVPGVSGGTIAFILGMYDQLINAISNLRFKEKRKESLLFLSKIAIGWIIGFIIAIFFITGIVETHAYQISSLFLGFILVSIPLTIKDEKATMKGNYRHLLFTIIGFSVVILISLFGQQIADNNQAATMSFGTYLYIFIVGTIAICSMLLPGISGSTILVIFGIYFQVITSLKEVLTFNFAHLPIVIALGLGILFGAIAFVRVISYLFKNYRSQTLYLIQGLMLGSIYPIILGPTTIGDLNLAPLSVSTFSIIAFLLGIIIILAIEKLKLIFNGTN